MSLRKELGKIDRAEFGFGGYQEACIGLTLEFSGQFGGVGTFKGGWAPSTIKITQGTKWTEEDRSQSFDEVVRFVDKILSEAKKRYVHELRGIPVEMTFDGTMLKDWRILTEVL